MKYKIHADANSLYNTPSCIRHLHLRQGLQVAARSMGGLEVMKERNEKKAKILYDFLDYSKLFKGTVRKEDRSLMNVPFVTGDKDLDAKFVKEAKEARSCEPEGTQNRRRHARKHLQCNADGGRGSAGCLHEESLKRRISKQSGRFQ